jgi:hypothetical protein
MDVQVRSGVFDKTNGECAFVGTPAPIVPQELPIEPCEPFPEIMPCSVNCFIAIEIQRYKPLEVETDDPVRECGTETLIGMPDKRNEGIRHWIIT